MKYKIGEDGIPRDDARKKGIWANCKNCGEFFASFKSKGKYALFCTKHCARMYESYKRKKREKINKSKKIINKIKRVRGFCKTCGGPVSGANSIVCMKCRKEFLSNENDKRTIKEIISKSNYKGSHRYQKIRNYAKKNMANKEKICEICGYKVYVEICHKRSISNFSLSDTLEEVNNINNLIYLCPNHHIELDLGLLKI